VHDAAVGSTSDQPTERVRDAYERIQVRLWRAVFAWSGSREVTDDAVAEAFAQAMRRGCDIRDVDRWVWRASFRIAGGYLKRDRADADLVVDIGEPTTLDSPEDRLDLEQALAVLSEQQRACVVLRDVAGLSASETAAVLGTTAATVRVQAMRGRRKLRQMLEVPDA
jgi:RNA polymerase sigma-70 factor (ECF subfamily)